jgi:hypothetical protein
VPATLAFVIVWMALGFVLRLDANSYVLAGLPITGAFSAWRHPPGE